jgi:hypothetical protein
LGTLARELDYDLDGRDPPEGWSWHEYQRGGGSGFTFIVAVPDVDIEEFEEAFNDLQVNSMTCDPCSTLRNEEDQVVDCAGSGSSCTCCEVSAPAEPEPQPPLTPEELERFRSFEFSS